MAIFILTALQTAAALDAMPDTARLAADLANQVRIEQGLPPLEYDPTLAAIAETHCLDMIERNYFGHQSPEGWLERHRVARWHRGFIGVTGENIWGMDGRERPASELAELMVDNWMESPKHKENILRPNYNRMGVGLVREGNKFRAAHLFAEAAARLDPPVEFRLQRGVTMKLTALAENSSLGPPAGCRLDTAKDDRPANDFQPLDRVVLDVEPGLYRLKFMFITNNGDRYQIYPGPMILVE
jgi:hypothetical protein